MQLSYVAIPPSPHLLWRKAKTYEERDEHHGENENGVVVEEDGERFGQVRPGKEHEGGDVWAGGAGQEEDGAKNGDGYGEDGPVRPREVALGDGAEGHGHFEGAEAGTVAEVGVELGGSHQKEKGDEDRENDVLDARHVEYLEDAQPVEEIHDVYGGGEEEPTEDGVTPAPGEKERGEENCLNGERTWVYGVDEGKPCDGDNVHGEKDGEKGRKDLSSFVCMSKEPLRLRDVGLALLGSAALIVALIALHFYVTEVLPNVGRSGFLSAYCQVWGERTAVVNVSNHGSDEIVEANVYVDGRLACQLRGIPARSTDVCKATAEENVAVFRVVALTSRGERIKEAGVCVRYGPAPVD